MKLKTEKSITQKTPNTVKTLRSRGKYSQNKIEIVNFQTESPRASHHPEKMEKADHLLSKTDQNWRYFDHQVNKDFVGFNTQMKVGPKKLSLSDLKGIIKDREKALRQDYESVLVKVLLQEKHRKGTDFLNTSDEAY